MVGFATLVVLRGGLEAGSNFGVDSLRLPLDQVTHVFVDRLDQVCLSAKIARKVAMLLVDAHYFEVECASRSSSYFLTCDIRSS